MDNTIKTVEKASTTPDKSVRLFIQASETTPMTPTEHEKREWRRMATDAYDKDLNDIGHRCSFYGALRIGESIPVQVFDEMQMNYREWLINGFKSGRDNRHD